MNHRCFTLKLVKFTILYFWKKILNFRKTLIQVFYFTSISQIDLESLLSV